MYKPAGYTTLTLGLGYSGSGFACPFLDAQWIGRSLIEGGSGSVVPFLIEGIDDGYYARLTVDEFYLPGRTSYRRRHFLHSLLVHGYDRARSLFRVAGYLPNGEYGSSEVTFAELEAAFAVGLEPLEEGDCDGDGNEGERRRFDGVGSRADLRRCMYSKRLSNVESNRVRAGPLQPRGPLRARLPGGPGDAGGFREFRPDAVPVREHPHLPRTRSTLSDSQSPTGRTSPSASKSTAAFGGGWRRFWRGAGNSTSSRSTCLWEHKKVMVWRLEYFERNGYLDPSLALSVRYREIEARAAHLRLLMMRCRMKQDRKLLARSLARVDNLREKESEVLGGVLRAARAAQP